MDDEPRPSCNCKASHCIRRYCHCFDGRWYCSDACRCESCKNTEDREAFVEERVEIVFKRRRGASRFDGFICTCRRSECKKKYCACFKNRVACTERCQCQGCANTHGAKAGATLLHNNGGCRASEGGSQTDGFPNGTSNETAMVTEEASLSQIQSRVNEDFAAFGDPSNMGQHVYAPSDSGRLVAFLNSVRDQHSFSQNVHTVMHQASLHGSANSTPHGLWGPNINSGAQDGPSGN